MLLLVKTGSLGGKIRMMTLCAPINLRVRALKRSRLAVLPLVILGKLGCCVRLVTIYKGTLEFFRYQRRFTDCGFFVFWGLARATPVSFICPRSLFRIVGLGLLFLVRLRCVGLQVVHCRHWRLPACALAPRSARGSRFWWWRSCRLVCELVLRILFFREVCHFATPMWATINLDNLGRMCFW